MAKVVIVAPHMDDETLGCGGLIQRFDQQDVMVIFVSERKNDQRRVDGEYVSYDGDDRIKEMRKVSKLLGFVCHSVGFEVHATWDFPALVRLLEIAFRGAELVLYPGISNDRDHQTTIDAVQATRRPHCYAGSLLQYYVWGVVNPFEPLVVLELNSREWAKKRAAMSLYQTQVAPGGHYDPLYPYSPESMEVYSRAAGRMIHAEHGEVFVPVRLVANETTGRLLT